MSEPDEEISYRAECPHCGWTTSSTANGRLVSFVCPSCGEIYDAVFSEWENKVEAPSEGEITDPSVGVPPISLSSNKVEAPSEGEITAIKAQAMRSEEEQFLGVTESAEQSSTEAPRVYPALRVIARIYRICAFLFGIAAFIVVVIGVGMLGIPGESIGIWFVLGGILLGVSGVVTSLAVAEGICVFLDIEENTRNTYYCLRNQQKKQ